MRQGHGHCQTGPESPHCRAKRGGSGCGVSSSKQEAARAQHSGADRSCPPAAAALRARTGRAAGDAHVFTHMCTCVCLGKADQDSWCACKCRRGHTCMCVEIRDDTQLRPACGGTLLGHDARRNGVCARGCTHVPVCPAKLPAAAWAGSGSLPCLVTLRAVWEPGHFQNPVPRT